MCVLVLIPWYLLEHPEKLPTSIPRVVQLAAKKRRQCRRVYGMGLNVRGRKLQRERPKTGCAPQSTCTLPLRQVICDSVSSSGLCGDKTTLKMCKLNILENTFEEEEEILPYINDPLERTTR